MPDDPGVMGRFGPLVVERLFHDERAGYVLRVRVERGAPDESIEIRCSPKGRKLSAVHKEAPDA